MRATLVAMAVSGALQIMACDAPSTRGDLASDPAALRVFWTLLQSAHLGFSNMEEAAFLVRDPSGSIRAVAWPETGEPNTGMWVGAFPANTIAIAHTHPNWMPSPSSIDVRTAKQARVPVYVVTRAHISRTDGRSITMVVNGDWKHRLDCGASVSRLDLDQTDETRADGESR